MTMVFNGAMWGQSAGEGAEADAIDAVEEEDERPGIVDVVARDEIELVVSDGDIPVSIDTREFQRNKG